MAACRDAQVAMLGRMPARAGSRLLAPLIVLAMLLSGTPARADDPKPPSIGSVRFGFAAEMPVERWTPVRIVVSPGSEAFGGVLVVEYPQDATQAARIVLPVTVAPGQPVEAQALINLPQSCANLTIALHAAADDGVTPIGIAVSSVEYSMFPRDGVLPFPPGLSIAAIVVGTLGDVRALDKDVPGQWYIRDPNDYSGSPGRDALVAPIEPGAMPIAWPGYQGFSALVVHAKAAQRADPRALGALREWVVRGGRLLIVADQPGPEWRQWLPPGAGGELVALEEPMVTPTPVSMPAPKGTAASTVPARLLRLTARGQAEGWQTRWSPAAGPAGSGYLAEGPVGLGLVAIVGIDPARTSQLVSSDAVTGVWSDALRTVMSYARTPPSRGRLSYYYGISGETPQAAEGLLATFDWIADVPPVGAGVFVAIAASMIGLGIFLGFGDYWILGRLKRRQQSWLTAPCWIALACAAAYYGPILLRPGETTIRRLSVIDAVQSQDETPSFACQTSLTAVFTNFSGRATFRPEAPGAAGGYWRGVSPLPLYRYSEPSRGLPMVAAAQRLGWGTVDPLGPAAGVSGAGSDATGAVLPTAIDFNRWTLRAFMDHGRTTLPIVAAVQPGSTPADLRIRIGGLPEGSQVVASAAARSASGWHTATFSPDGSGGWSAVVNPAALEEPDGMWTREAGSHALTSHYGMACAMVSASGREESLEARARSGRWVVLYLYVSGLPMDVSFNRPCNAGRTAVVRIAVPLPESLHASPREAPPLPR